MTAALLEGEPCASAHVVIPQRGAWFADVAMLAEVALSGAVTLAVGSLEFRGTITSAGTRGEQSFFRVTAGAGGWSTPLPAKHYHSDARVRLRTVAEDAAREAGETLDTLTTTDDVGTAYTRRAGPASRVFADVVGPNWYVGADGVTYVGERPAGAPADGAYVVVEVEPDIPRAILAMDDFASVTVGMTLSEGLDDPIVVREIEITIDADSAVMTVWGGGSSTSGDRLGDALRGVIARERAREIFGLWRYRVSEMDGDRVKLQAVAADAGLPDVLPIDMHPGAAGYHADLAPGAEVLIQFIEGDPRRPVLTNFGGRRAPGFVPTRVTLDAQTEILLGADAAQFVALANLVLSELNAIKTAYDAHTHGGVTTGVGATGVPAAPMPTPGSVAASLTKAE